MACPLLDVYKRQIKTCAFWMPIWGIPPKGGFLQRPVPVSYTHLWKDIQGIREGWQCERVFYPSLAGERREALARGWHKAVGRSLDWEAHA